MYFSIELFNFSNRSINKPLNAVGSQYMPILPQLLPEQRNELDEQMRKVIIYTLLLWNLTTCTGSNLYSWRASREMGCTNRYIVRMFIKLRFILIDVKHFFILIIQSGNTIWLTFVSCFWLNPTEVWIMNMVGSQSIQTILSAALIITWPKKHMDTNNERLIKWIFCILSVAHIT